MICPGVLAKSGVDSNLPHGVEMIKSLVLWSDHAVGPLTLVNYGSEKKYVKSKVTISAYSAQARANTDQKHEMFAMDSSFEDRQKDVNLTNSLKS